MINNIIFDFDGVIVDSEILASKAFYNYFLNQGLKLKEKDFYNYAGMKTVQVIDILSLKYQVKNKKKFSSDIFELISRIYTKDLKLVDGFKAFINNSKRNHFIGSNSNKDRIISGLNIVGMTEMFINKNIYSFDMVKNPKPHPDIYLKIIDDNKLKLDETIIIEDSSIGVRAGSLAGAKVFGLTAGQHWYLNRDKNELYDNGAINVFDDYNSLSKAIGAL
tara:strand:+ start:57 stop:716 length:660 start_codon:yes stop_codon:yes gene_type:complete